ncbi:hypothetical protein HQ325_12315 [Rhodococcus sp. BP-349]|uniref:asparagine synthase-related protein n=1 Tax=unclassified Rhodococcus (in: high G+C Gram-positive bacteria) TaxID=192944 RepID=UPI001C9A5132|nr:MULTISPECIES: asparagine synthase-related protein [unclassified Rhodococcus (in: high G+C Gram-positive bacteria)]MBY6539458.1 hypothetical protein [Rhodococcus sp. BP-363]MBY6544214.1 hypothetical protein [Rhodococcus sp. BP-369]MBY6563444.1 hypothetical protein [Rhodococcus sp. BP-370]MBY6577736.1 hypothetical protein [Rhodococcus sp. BP-364]MBY6587037.1 hypothetical protein [Rhodococcus sp. BP-358]
MTSLECASSALSGFDRNAQSLPDVGPVPPKAAFHGVIRDALLRPPCLVSFSGGRDSSSVLAAAVSVARTEGLPLPVPVTMSFPADTASHEESWQHLVLDHLGITDRIVHELHDEMDIIGPDATAVLDAHGLMFPMNVHFHRRIFADAAGGTVLTGLGGDELGNAARERWTERSLAAGDVTGRTLSSLSYHLSPRVARIAVDIARTRTGDVAHPWLNGTARRELRVLSALDRASEPLGWSRVLREWIPRHRYFTVVRDSFDRVARDTGTTVLHPFIEPATLSALASHNPFVGVGGRRALLRVLMGEDLPELLVTRKTKAEFGNSFWTDNTRRFAQSWTGGGFGDIARYIDEDGLRAEWSKQVPDARSMLLLQQLWMNASH